jgi:hypothetical protein
MSTNSSANTVHTSAALASIVTVEVLVCGSIGVSFSYSTGVAKQY